MGHGVSTVKRWLKNGKALGFFRSTKTEYGVATVYYASTNQVCAALGLTDFGVVTEIDLKDLKCLKAIATQAEVQKLQQASHYKAGKDKKHPVPNASEILPTSDKSQRRKLSGATGRILRTGKRFMFVSPDFTLFGGSQKTTAKNLDRTARTISRRLSNRDRVKKGLPILERRQLAIVCSKSMVLGFDALNLSGDRDHSYFFSLEMGAIAPKCNLYLSNLYLKAAKWAKMRLNIQNAKKFPLKHSEKPQQNQAPANLIFEC